MQLVYFVSGRHRLSREEAHDLGLRYAFPGPEFVCAEYTAPGPGGEHGCVLGVATEGLGYYPDRQTWLALPQRPGVFVGMWRDQRPTPAELSSARPLRGSWLTLRDGQSWLIPVAREWTGGTSYARTLPGTLILGPEGHWTSGGVDPQHARLWEIAESFWACLFGTQLVNHTLTFDFPGANDAAVEVLAANYRIGRAEVALLGLLDDQLDLTRQILECLVDLPTFLAWQKKSLPPEILAGAPMSVGAPDSLPDTPPPSSTSGRSRPSRK